MEEQQDDIIITKKKHRRPEENGRDRFFVLRQILNIMFMVVAIIGVVFYVNVNELQGIIVVVIAMAFKMAECVLRYVK